MQRLGILRRATQSFKENLEFSYFVPSKIKRKNHAINNSNICSIRSYSQTLELTKDRYNVPRGKYNKVNKEHINYFKNLLGETRIITEPSEVEGYNIDKMRVVKGYSQLVVKPKTTQQVSEILKYCNSQKLAVCPQGGNTGLVAGSVPVHDEVILSTVLMNEIIHLDETTGALICQAGCVLETLDNYVGEKNLMMPLDLGAKGSCHIGGNVSTNAGGLRLLRYGNLHGSVLGIEAVKANGEIIDCLNTLKKDNTGYHLKHLFIGSEGTLGIVTKVAIQCPPKSSSVNLLFLATESFEMVLKILKQAKISLGEILSSCELIDEESMKLVNENVKLKNPMENDSPFYVLIETSGSNSKHDEEKLNNFLEVCMNESFVTNGIIATQPSHIYNIWQVRERISEALALDGYPLKYDISLPIKDFYTIVPVMAERLGSDAKRVCGYGHMGDGNLHLNISLPKYDHNVIKKVEPFVFEFTSKLKGSISAEHGIGFKNKNYLSYSKSPGAISLMRQIKTLMDPNGILNPYKVLPPEN